MRTPSPEKNVSSIQVTFTITTKGKRGRPPQSVEKKVESGNVPRISKLMALAIRFNGLIERGDIRDYADLARLGYVTRARITQIMNLLNLAPEIQESLLFLPRTVKGYDPIVETDIRPIAAVVHWPRQRKMWKEIKPIELVRSP